MSIGGQSYGSITEDNNTSQALAAAGFSSMYLDEKLQAGLAPDDIPGVFEQRLRWATGALQIWWRANPLRRPGMTATQRLLYYDTSAYPLLGMSTLILCVVPIVYLVSWRERGTKEKKQTNVTAHPAPILTPRPLPILTP